METNDTHTSLYEALFHASLDCGIEVKLIKINSSSLEKTENIETILGQNGYNVDGVLVPGDFGQSGLEGMIKAATWARINKKPFFGISLGMHVMIIEWARNILNWTDADSAEISPNTKYPVISAITNQGTKGMRLGSHKIVNNENTHIITAYGQKYIEERYRHRSVFANQYRDEMINSGLNLAAFNSDGSIVECVEWQSKDHPWGVGVQFHPEYKSKPMKVSPLFKAFIVNCAKGNT
jgi:CTP synthase